MITLNSENELVEIPTYDDLLSRPRFCEVLDPATAKLEKLIGYYVFAPRVACGLSNCRKQHFTGFLAATKDGREVNIGNVCGKREFGFDFVTAKRRLMADVRRARNREVVQEFIARLPSIRAALNGLRNAPMGTKEVYYSLRWARSHLPHSIWKHIENALRTGDGALVEVRLASAEEVALHQERTGKSAGGPLYLPTVVGRIDGFEAFKSSNDLRELVDLAMLPRLDEISAVDVDVASDRTVGAAAKYARDFDLRMREIKMAHEAGRRFLTRGNVLQFEHLPLSRDDVETLRAFAVDLPDHYEAVSRRQAA